jgi:hypothetical protein
MNTRQQGAQFVTIPVSQWLFGNDPSIDVAVAPMQIQFIYWDHILLPLGLFITQEVIIKEEVGVGDELFFPGLFTRRPGDRANIPIVRAGNIAAMPDEPIQSKWGPLKPPYLVEARSIGGLSGSPVFWYRGPSRIKSNEIQMGGQRFFLLGLVHGHYDIKDEWWDCDDDTSTDSVETRSLNMGIAMVVPASDILETLNLPELQQQRENTRQAILAQRQLSLPVPDAIAEAPAEMSVQVSTDSINVPPDIQ